MSLTVIDPQDGTCYEILYESKKWTIHETNNGLVPQELEGSSVWTTQEQALKALREMCAHKNDDCAANPHQAAKR